jgi:hypothetical protein
MKTISAKTQLTILRLLRDRRNKKVVKLQSKSKILVNPTVKSTETNHDGEVDNYYSLGGKR